jgi:serine/threonine protein phosphatase PrpC
MKYSPDHPPEETATAARFSVTMSIHQGERDHQEDACGHWFDLESRRLFAVVADGAGGHGGGAEASQAAITSSVNFWEQSSATAFEDPEAFLTEWMKQAHVAVNEAAAKIHRSARAVVVACVTDGRSAHWVHAGDCRLLRFHEGKLVERTRDDSVVQVLFERGDITEEEMGTHPDQSRLLQSLGGGDAPTPRLGRSALEAGDTLILCSDGFWEHLKPAELEKLAVAAPAKRQQALDLAVKEAVRRAGAKADNTTAVMIHCDPTGGAKRRVMAVWLAMVVLAAIAGVFAAWWLQRRLMRPQNPVPSQTEPSSPQDTQLSPKS